jgi:predicted anti-sigma-YlaC factor YlaD
MNSATSDPLRTGRWKLRAAAALIAAAGLSATGCASLQKAATNKVADALSADSDVYASDNDIELVGAATPFGLKTIESVLAAAPEHPGLLLAATRGFTQYAYVYVQLPADELEERDVNAAYAERARAQRLYLRARDYGLRALGAPGATGIRTLQTDPDAVLRRAAKPDVALLYWTGVAWAAAISLSKDQPTVVAQLPAVRALVARAAALDPDYDYGSLQAFLISFEMANPTADGNVVQRARAHFERAVELSSGLRAAPYVALAESVAAEQRDRREYEALLGQAVRIDADARPDWRLANLVMQRRARWLLAHSDELFPEPNLPSEQPTDR